MTSTQMMWTVIGGCGLAIVALLVGSLYTVEQQSVAVIQRLGKFVGLAGPGIHARIPIIDRVAGRMNLRVQQLDVSVETKTSDNVFLHMIVSVQYFVLPEKVYEGFYNLDDVFERKDDIAEAVKVELSHVMEGFGYGIVKALVTDIEPDPHVKAAMNEINAAQRMRVAANEKGEADRILKVKAAEGDAQSKALQGKGIADQRQAIVAGLRDSVDEFRRSVRRRGATRS